MNIFVLDLDVEKCAKYHCDKHVVKMITEYVQLLSTCLHYYGFDAPYKPTHLNHPCNVWVRSSIENYQWLYALTEALHSEYRHRYGDKIHLAYKKMKESVPYNPKFNPEKMTKFPNCSPYKEIEDVVWAYRLTYMTTKRHFMKWTNRSKPDWFVVD